MEEFDKIVREQMAEGAEEVPAGLWNAVQNRLPAGGAGKTRVVPIWARRAAAMTAVAAATALAVIFGGRKDEAPAVDIIRSGEQIVAEVSPESLQENLLIGVETENVPSAMPSQKQLWRQREAALLADHTDDAEPEQGAELQVPEDTEQSASNMRKDERTQAIQTQDAFRAAGLQAQSIQEEDPMPRSRKFHTDLAIFGVAASSTNPGGKSTQGPMRIPAALPSATGITETSESSYLMPLSVGASIRFHITERWAVDLGLNCTSLYRTYAGTFREVDEQGITTRVESFTNIRNSQAYIGIPVNASFSIISNNIVDFYAYAGGSVEKCLVNKHSMNADAGVEVFKDATGGAVFSAGLGFGCEFTIARHLGIYIDPNLRYYFKNSSTPKSIRTQQPLMAGLELGLRFKL